MGAPAKNLWGHREFLKLWGAQTISSVGARIAREGLPMAAVITLKAGPEALGLFAAISLGCRAAFGLIAGDLADRLPRRALMIGADLGRAVVLAAVPAAALLGHLSLIEIYLAGALMGVFNVVFDMADHAFLPQLLETGELMEGNTKLSTTDAVAEVAGPGIGGALVGLITAPLAVAVTALTYLVSAVTLAAMRPAKPAPADAPPPAPEPFSLTAGARIVLAHPLVRPLWLAELTRAFFGGFFSALYLFFCLAVLKLTPLMMGITVTCGGLGGLVGAMATPAIVRRLGAGRAIGLTGLAGGSMIFLIPAAHGAPLLAMAFLVGAQVLGDCLQTTTEIAATTMRQSVLPPAALGRAAGAFATGAALLGVVGALTGGFLGATIGPRETLLISASGITAASFFALFSPLWGMREAAAEAS